MVPQWVGKEYVRLWPVAVLPTAGLVLNLMLASESGKKAGSKSICHPQTTPAPEHHRSRLLELGLSIAFLENKLTLLYYQKG